MIERQRSSQICAMNSKKIWINQDYIGILFYQHGLCWCNQTKQTTKMKAPHKRKTKPLNIACWNVRTLLDRDKAPFPPKGRTAIVAMELARFNVLLEGQSCRRTEASRREFCHQKLPAEPTGQPEEEKGGSESDQQTAMAACYCRSMPNTNSWYQTQLSTSQNRISAPGSTLDPNAGI